jgi:hypothetical protein
MKLSTYFVFLFSLLFLTAVSSVAQTGKEQKPSSKKMSSKLFGRSVLFPETITVRADGTPVFVASNDGLEISVAAFRGANYLYFQVEFENSSDKPYLFSALDFSMTDDRGFKVRGIDINYVREDLAGSARGPAPPPPAPQVSTTTINTTTTGTVDPYGNVNARTTGQATTRTGPDPYYQAGYALGSLLSRGSRKTEQSFVEDLSAFGVNYSTIGPGEKQRVYIAFAMVKSKSVTLSLPQEFNSRVTFNWKKPKS